jgi:hypothetical protein
MSAEIRFPGIAAAALAVLALSGCGDGGGGGGKLRGLKDEPVKKIIENQASAARSCIRNYAGKQLKARRARLAELRKPLQQEEARFRGLGGRYIEGRPEGAPVEGKPVTDPEKLRLLKESRSRYAELQKKLGPGIGSLQAEIARFRLLEQRLSGRRPAAGGRLKGLCEIKDHQVEPLNKKARDQRVSTMTLQPVGRPGVLGTEPMKFRLIWRRVERRFRYSPSRSRVDYELKRTELLSGGLKSGAGSAPAAGTSGERLED